MRFAQILYLAVYIVSGAYEPHSAAHMLLIVSMHEQTLNPSLAARYNCKRKKPFHVEIRVSTYAKIFGKSFELEDGESFFIVWCILLLAIL